MARFRSRHPEGLPQCQIPGRHICLAQLAEVSSEAAEKSTPLTQRPGLRCGQERWVAGSEAEPSGMSTNEG